MLININLKKVLIKKKVLMFIMLINRSLIMLEDF